MLKLGDEVTIVSSASYSKGEWSEHVGKTTMVNRITAYDGDIRYGLKDVTKGTDMWSADDLQPTGRKLLESSIGKNLVMPGDMAIIEIADAPQERRVYTARCVFDPLGTIIGIELMTPPKYGIISTTHGPTRSHTWYDKKSYDHSSRTHYSRRNPHVQCWRHCACHRRKRFRHRKIMRICH